MNEDLQKQIDMWKRMSDDSLAMVQYWRNRCETLESEIRHFVKHPEDLQNWYGNK